MSAPRTYLWPRFLLAAVLLGILIAVFAVMNEAKRIREMKKQVPHHVEPLPGQ